MQKNTRALAWGLGFALLVPLVVSLLTSSPEPAGPGELHGLWASAWGEREGERVRFYYFHDEGGIGLYRYGRVGLNQTNSFTWSVDGRELVLRFTKTGEERRTPFSLVERDGAKVLVLDDDPRDAPKTAYRFIPPPPLAADEEAADHPLARMWTHAEQFREGGMGFHIYQLKAPALDGRGVGWFHAGDFSDWTTETLVYRMGPERVDLFFPIRGERATSAVTLAESGGRRLIDLADDPRNYWHRRVYVDGGRSFVVEEPMGAALALPGSFADVTAASAVR